MRGVRCLIASVLLTIVFLYNSPPHPRNNRYVRSALRQDAEGTATVEQVCKEIEQAEMDLAQKNKKYMELSSKLETLRSEARSTQETIDQGARRELLNFSETVDARSIFVGNVDYQVNTEMLERHFNTCGTITRVTIPQGTKGPKGFAYVEFVEESAVDNAMKLNNTVIKGRALNIFSKRTNKPGLKFLGAPPRRKGRFM
eukprot:jgi/Bigna1/81865/fgenesh1_pg.85_\